MYICAGAKTPSESEAFDAAGTGELCDGRWWEDLRGGSGCGDGVERVQATRRAALEMSGPRYLPGEDDLTGYGGAKNGGFADRFPQIVCDVGKRTNRTATGWGRSSGPPMPVALP